MMRATRLLVGLLLIETASWAWAQQPAPASADAKSTGVIVVFGDSITAAKQQANRQTMADTARETTSRRRTWPPHSSDQRGSAAILREKALRESNAMSWGIGRTW